MMDLSVLSLISDLSVLKWLLICSQDLRGFMRKLAQMDANLFSRLERFLEESCSLNDESSIIHSFCQSVTNVGIELLWQLKIAKEAAKNARLRGDSIEILRQRTYCYMQYLCQ